MNITNSDKQLKLQETLRARRRVAGITQVDLSEKLGQYRTFITKIEQGSRKVEALEFMDIAEAVGFDPYEALREIHQAG